MRATLLWSALLLPALLSDGIRAADCVTDAESSCLPSDDLKSTLPPQGAVGTEQAPEPPAEQAPAGTEQPPEQAPEQPSAQAPAGTEQPPEQPSQQPPAQAPAGTEQPPEQATAGTEQPPEQATAGTEQPPAQVPAGTKQPPEQPSQQPPAQAPAGTEQPPEQPTEQPPAQGPSGTEQPPEQPSQQPPAQAPAGTEQPPEQAPEQPSAQAPAGTEQPPEQPSQQPPAQAPAGTEQPPAQVPAGTEQPPEQPSQQPPAQAPAGTEQPPEQPPEHPPAQAPSGTEQPPEQPSQQPPSQAPAGTEQPPEQPPADTGPTTNDSLQSNCQPLVLCPAALADTASTGNQSCLLGDGSTGVICGDIGINPLEQASHAPGHRTDDQWNASRPIAVDHLINELFIVVSDDVYLQEAAKQAAHHIQEQKLQGSHTAPRDSPVGLFSLNSGSRHGLHQIGQQCLHHQLTLQAVSEQGKSHLYLVSRFGGGQAGTNVSVVHPTLLHNCTVAEPIVCQDSLYRTADGTCNNLQRPREGASRTGFKRLLQSTFDDDVAAIRSRSVKDLPLPNPRLISERMVRTISKELSGFTLSVMQWGQFIDHDFNRAPEFNEATDPLECCEDGGRMFPATPLHLQCIPFSIPADDPFYSQFGQRCMRLVRSLPAPPLDCIARPTTPLNVLTSHLDASNMYGSGHEEQNELRAFRDGLLITSDNNLLPLVVSPKLSVCGKNASVCFRAGDDRVNEQSALTVMHTIFMREHNRVAGVLKQNHRDWDDEKLFQEARRIVIAEWQHIIYNEWLPIIVGFDYARDHDLMPLTSGFSIFYDVHVNPTASNEFATAAFRFGHSMLRDLYHMVNANGDITQSINLTTTFFNPSVITQRFVEHARTLVATRCEAFDTNIISSVHQKLFMTNGPFGLDLIAINIQRGRDHGIPTYVTMLKACTGVNVSSWGDLNGLMSSVAIDQLRSLYDDPRDVDLFIGGLAERQAPGAQVGPTFQCVIGQQFYDVRFGDRFFYDNGGFQHSFTIAQLKEIRKSSWARIMCDTLGPEFGNDFTQVQPLAFVESSVGANGAMACDSQAIPSMNLAVFE